MLALKMKERDKTKTSDSLLKTYDKRLQLFQKEM
jgi:hypothetical protein